MISSNLHFSGLNILKRFSALIRRIRGGVQRAIAFAVMGVYIAATVVGPAYAAPGPLPFTEGFDNTSERDAGQTTADWGVTVLSALTQPTAVPLTTPFSGASVASTVSAAADTRGIAVGDMDGDGDLDLVEATENTNAVYLNNGAGVFGAANVISADVAVSRGIALGDMDRDGDLDIVVVNFGATARLYLNAGDGVTYTGSDISSTTGESTAVAVADIDGDGTLDVVEADGDAGPTRVYFNTGDPITPFGPFGVTGSSINPDAHDSAGVLAGDLDNDGDIDLIVLNQNQINVQYINNGAGSFSSNDIGAELDNSIGGALGDMNADGLLDLVVINFDAVENSKIYFNDGVGSPFELVGNNFYAPGNPRNATSVALADADNDGTLDIFLGTAGVDIDPQTNRIFFNTAGTGVGLTASVIGAELDTTRSVVAADVTGDGNVDFIAGSNSRTGPGTQVNRLYANVGGASANPAVQQLSSVAQSVRVDTEVAPILSVKMSTTSTSVGPAFHNDIDYWVSGDGGVSWAAIVPGATPTLGRPVLLPGVAGTNLLWRGTLRSDSSANLGAMAVSDLTLARNSTGPAVNTAIGAQVATEDTPFSVTADIPDADGDTVTYSVSGLPVGTGLSINPVTGEISGSPTNGDATASPSALTVTASDGAFTATDSFNLTVANTNDNPQFDSAPVTAGTQGVLYSYSVVTSDRDPTGDTLTISDVSAPAIAWLSVSPTVNGTATLSGTPGPADVGVHNVSLQVLDGLGGIALQNFAITVANINDPPVFDSVAVTAATQDTAYAYMVMTSDPDALDTRTITATSLPASGWLSLLDNGDGTATLSGTPVQGDVAGPNAVTLEVEDAAGATATQIFSVVVANVNDAPSIDSTEVTAVSQGANYVYNVTASDPDTGDVLTITDISAPAVGWLSLVDAGGGIATLLGTPGILDVGSHNVVLQVEDAGGLSDSQAFTITVTNTNDAPTFTAAPIIVATEAVEYLYSITTQDLDADTVTITAPLLPTWLSLTDNGDGTAELRGTPAGGDVGDHPVTLNVADPGGLNADQMFTVAVTAAVDAPTISVTGANPATVQRSATYTDEGATASDAQDGDLTASIMVDNPVDTAIPGNYTVTYTVADSSGNMAQAQRTVTVQAPTPTPTPPASGGGGGSTGLAELGFLVLLGSFGAVGRRRRKMLGDRS